MEWVRDSIARGAVGLSQVLVDLGGQNGRNVKGANLVCRNEMESTASTSMREISGNGKENNSNDSTGNVKSPQEELRALRKMLEAAARQHECDRQRIMEQRQRMRTLERNLEAVQTRETATRSNTNALPRTPSGKPAQSLSHLIKEYDLLAQEMEKQTNSLEKENESQVKTIGSLRVEKAELENEVATLQLALSSALSEVTNLQKKIQTEQDTAARQTTIVEKQKTALYDEVHRRKSFQLEVARLRGRIRVFCRLRPMLRNEAENKSPDVVCPHPLHFREKIQVSRAVNPAGSHSQEYSFDHVFGPESSQEDVFAEVKDMCSSLLLGVSATVFAYGQTGAGKTYTMLGTKENPGVNYRAVDSIFQERSRLELAGWKYTFSVSLLEVYNENIYDLLATVDAPRKPLAVRMKRNDSAPSSSATWHVAGLKQHPVKNLEDVFRFLTLGNKRRALGSHDLNDKSSRSHLIFTLAVRGERGKEILCSKLNLVDLAGSERLSKTGATGTCLNEAKAINKSLSSLGNVISALKTQSMGRKSKNQHVPFRDSKLTQVLQSSMQSGASQVLMFANISPVETNLGETLCTIKFARRAMKCMLGKVKTNFSTGNNPPK